MPADITPLFLHCRFPRLLVAGYRSLFEVTVASISSEPVADVVIEFRCEGFQSGIVEHRLARPLAPYERLDPIVIGILLESAGVMPMTVHVHASTARGRSTGRGHVRPLEQPGVTILERPADLQSFKLEIREKAFFGAIMEGMDLGKFTSINDLIGTPLDAPVEPVRLAWDGFPVVPTLKPGLMFGPFRLVRRIGGGGMGVVWEAQDTSLKDKVVALKFLPETVCHDPSAIDDLRDEVLKARELRNDHIVSIYHFHEHDGTAAISMECIDGPTLDALRREQPHKVLEVAELRRLLPSLCAALDYAHRPPKPLVHHDLKPLNLMLNGDGELKVCDFGLAGGLSEARTKLSLRKGGPSTASGTLYYMSPQHLLLGSRVVTDDVYSLGATLYELLTSKPPFYAGSIETQIEQIVPPTMAERRRILGITGAEPIPEAWERAVAACLAKNPNARPQSAGALLAMCDEPSSTARREASWSAVASDSATPLSPRPGTSSGPPPVAEAKAPALSSRPPSGNAQRSDKALSRQRLATALQDASRQRTSFTKLLPWLIGAAFLLIAWAAWPHSFTLEVPDKRTVESGSVGKLLACKLNNVDIKLCYCPSGSFKMGSPSEETGRSSDEDQVDVTLPKGFWLGQTEVTQAQWRAVMGSNPSHFKGDDLPVGSVSWEDAQAFIAKLNSSGKLPSGWVFALPTEAQWEYGCRAGTPGPYAGELGEMAWYDDNVGSTTHPVATKKQNAWGLYDMHGNLWEWCFDGHESKLPGGTDPVVKTGSFRVVRGGDWIDPAGYCRSAYRYWGVPGFRFSFRGFRVAAVPAGSGASQ